MPKYKDPKLMRELYIDRGKSIETIADELGVSPNTVHRWLGKHGIKTRTSNQDKPACFYTDSNGYEYWATRVNGRKVHFAVHRLLAVAEYGFDAVADRDVHHFNSIPWDNRPSNVGVIDHADHGVMHLQTTW